ncbi:SpoIIE family protein phosphatase [Streptomyces ferrugineus]|uniref:protein-serine/threonine phosphatase n=1 Tax=Streptomyces ferrugineus TaxID=1413221 RepID=A0A7M2T0D4_9ACTN|nr:SpoIIE family protein phosphatase [Streptomyces ferrugineus]
MRGTDASVGLVYVLPPGERVLRLVLVAGVPAQIAAPWARIPVDARIPVADAIRDRRLVWLPSQEEMARRYPRVGIVLPYDFMLAAAPITTDTDTCGGLVLLWPVGHPPGLSPTQHEAIATFCRDAGGILRQAEGGGCLPFSVDEPRVLPPPHPQGEADPARARAALEFTHRVPVGCCSLDLDGRITFVNPAGADLVGTGDLLGKLPWEVLPWLRDPAFEDRYRQAVVTRRPTSFTALRPPDTWLSFRLYPDESGISVHITPAPIGSTVAEPSPGPTQPVGATVGATSLYHLTHLAVTLTEAVGVGDVVEMTGDQLVPAFGPTALALMAAEEGRLRIIGYRGYSAELVARFDGAPLTSETPAVRVLTTGVPGFFASFADLKRAYPPAVHQDGMASWAFLPLIVSGRPVGSLVLAYDRPRSFPPSERAVLTSIAGLIAQALGRARLYDAKHSLAHTLQTGLLPRTLPAVPGLDVAARYRPAGHGMDIGGDFYDLIHDTPTTAVAAIGDVQGHNTEAAALMGQVRTAVHTHATVGTAPAELLARTNRLLTDLDAELFTSCLIARLDLAHHRAHLATAGHPPPLLRHPDGRTEALDVPTGLLLGIDPEADYPGTEISLPPGAVLVLYTDGLVEVPGTDIGDSTRRLARHLARETAHGLDDLADSLLHHADRSAPRSDDVALLLIRPRV